MVTARFSEWIAQACGVRPEEGRRTLLAAGFYFLFVAHVVMVKSATNALFLSRHDPRQLPVLYILVALLVAVVVLFASHLLADPRRRGLRVFILGMVAGVYLLGWLILHLNLLPASPALYLFAEVSATALNIQFWAVVGDIFDPQEGKRVFGVISGVGMAGSVCSGVFVHHAGIWLGTVNLLLATVAVLMLCVLLAWRMNRYRGRSDSFSNKEAVSLSSGLRYVFGTKYPRLFGGLMLLGAVLTSLVDYFFRTSARQFLSEDGLASLFGDLNVYVGALSVTTMLFFSSRILQRAGIFYYLIMVPLALMAACISSIAFAGFFFVYAMKVIESAGSLSVNQAGLQLLYNPVPTMLRAPVRGVIDGFLRKAGYAVGGLLLLLLAARLPKPYYQLSIVLLVILYIAILLRLRRLYVRALDERLRVGTTERAEINVSDASTQRVLLRALKGEDPQHQCIALNLLKDVREVNLEPFLPRLLFSNQQQVQLAAIEAVVTRRYLGQSLNLLALVNQGERRIRAAAMRALLALDPAGAVQIAEPFLHSTDPGLVSVSIEALLQLRGFTPDNPALPVLEDFLQRGPSAPPGTRRETARLLGRLGECPYSERLLQYLNDPDFSVQRIAVCSAAAIYRPQFVPRLLQMLSQRETRKEARETLAAWGDRIIDVLEQWLNDRERSLEIRLRLPRLIRMIGSQRAAEVLLFSNIQDDAFLRYRIVLALSGMRLNPNIKFNRQWALEAVERRLESYRHYLPIYQRLRACLAPEVIVLRALWERLEQNLEIVFRLLGLIYPHRTLMNVFYKLQTRRQPDWADALELLENILERELRQGLFPILETHRQLIQLPTSDSIIPLSPQAQEALQELSASRDRLLRAAAVFTRVRLGEDCANLMPELRPGKDSMNQMEIVLFLESVNIFRQNNLDDLTALAAIAKERSFQAGEYILRQGEPGEALYIITSGRVEIRKKERRILEVGEKASLGSVSLLDQKPHAADAVALTETHTLVIDRTDFMDLVADRVELLRGIFLALTERLRALLAVTEEGGLAEDGLRDGPTNPV